MVLLSKVQQIFRCQDNPRNLSPALRKDVLARRADLVVRLAWITRNLSSAALEDTPQGHPLGVADPIQSAGKLLQALRLLHKPGHCFIQ